MWYGVQNMSKYDIDIKVQPLTLNSFVEHNRKEFKKGVKRVTARVSTIFVDSLTLLTYLKVFWPSNGPVIIGAEPKNHTSIVISSCRLDALDFWGNSILLLIFFHSFWFDIIVKLYS